MPIKAEITADSFNPAGCRLTTFVLEYPRFVHAELMTHRVFSKNAASSRAIPIEKMIEQVQINPALPVWWGKNQSGMQANQELDNTIKNTYFLPKALPEYNEFSNGGGYSSELGHYFTYLLTDLEIAKVQWLQARDKAIESVEILNKIGLHKQIANRILEPWFHIKIILSGTEFENWFALRAHKDAQPEIRALAEKMLEIYNASEPKYLKEGEWHIPFGERIDDIRLLKTLSEINGDWAASPAQLEESRKKISIARCARISYLNYEGKDDYAADIKLCDRLSANNPKHLSPTEHIAQAQKNSDWNGNFRGFLQYRKFFKDENLSDSRVLKKFKSQKISDTP